MARRYNLNPIELISPGMENPFLRLAYISKIAEAGAEFENEQYEKAQQKAEREAMEETLRLSEELNKILNKFLLE